MTTRIAALIRHGAYAQPEGVPSAHLAHPLTPEGRGHAMATAGVLVDLLRSRGLPLLPRIRTSSLLRAYQTATIIAGGLGGAGLEVNGVDEHPELAERALGAGANLSVEQIERLLDIDPRVTKPNPGWKRDPDYRLPWIGAESLRMAGARVAEFIEAQLREGPEGVLVCVGHGGAFRHAAVHWGLLSDDEAARCSMHYGGAIFVAMDAGGSFRHVAGAWKPRGGAAAQAVR